MLDRMWEEGDSLKEGPDKLVNGWRRGWTRVRALGTLFPVLLA